jgi:hypothetical protein
VGPEKKVSRTPSLSVNAGLDSLSGVGRTGTERLGDETMMTYTIAASTSFLPQRLFSVTAENESDACDTVAVLFEKATGFEASEIIVCCADPITKK